jgi:hypothetical protein
MSIGLGITETIRCGLSGCKVGIVWRVVEGKIEEIEHSPKIRGIRRYRGL